MCERSQGKHGQRDSGEGKEEEAREEPLEQNERRGAIVLTHIPGQQQLIYTHTEETIWFQEAIVKNKLHTTGVRNTSAGRNKMHCKISGLQLFFFPLLVMTGCSDYWIVAVLFFQHVKFKEI